MFIAFKIAWALLRPGTFLALSLTLGVILWLFGGGHWRKLGQGLAVAVCAVFISILFLPIGSLLLWPLENRVARTTLPDEVAGIVVLGGAISVALSDRHAVVAVNDASERLFAGLALARRYPDARLIYSGGSGLPYAMTSSEAEIARRLFDELGLSGGRFVFESESRNTRENAVYSLALATPIPGEVWVLVTSAAHMPRSLAVFQNAGWDILPYPVDFRGDSTSDPTADIALTEELDLIEYAIREWLGLVAYRMVGWTDSFWPETGKATD